MNGFSSKVTTNEENTHHYAGHLLAGFYLWNWVGNLSTRVREYAQGGVHFNGWRPAFAPDQVDIAMGDIAQEHGRNLATGYLTIWDLPNAIRKALAP